MYLTKVFAIAGLFATAAIAAPNAEPNNPPPKPPKPSPNPNPVQTNACGNDVTPYCCGTDNKGQYSSCYAFQFSSQCSQTTVCCNNNNGLQVCVGNADIITVPYYPYPV